MLILTPEQLAEHGDNLVLAVGDFSEMEDICRTESGCFPQEANAEALFNTAQRAFDAYDAWDERMQSMALSESTLKSLLDASYRIFHNPLMVSTTEGFMVDHSSLMDTLPEFQEILSHNQVSVDSLQRGTSGALCRPALPGSFFLVTKRNNLFVEIYDKNRNSYRVILVEASQKAEAL